VRHAPAVLAFALAFGTALDGHEILGPVQVNQILKSMARSSRTLAAPPNADEKGQALINLGVDAYTLMKLINSDIKEHGTENQGLIDLAVGRCAEMGVKFSRVPGGPFYMYDFDAFSAYLKLSPHGEHAAEARFALLERAFYGQGTAKTPAALLQSIDEKQKLLKDYPEFKRRADVEMFLILDYLDLSNSYIERNEQAKGAQYKDLALQLCRQVAEKYPDTGAASFARNLLIQLGL
jgi:hypothetical protein